MLGDPPVVLFVKGTDGDGPTMLHVWKRCRHESGDGLEAGMRGRRKRVPGTATDSKLVLVGAPFDTSRRPVDTEQDQSGLPFPRRLSGPNVGITVLRTGNDPVGTRGPGDGGDELVVLQGR